MDFTWVKCCVCGHPLCQQTDSYRFTADGSPICYDCEEEGEDE